MPRRILERIQAAIRAARYDVTAHAVEEMAEDCLKLTDVESAILGGVLASIAKDDPRGARYTIRGLSADG